MHHETIDFNVILMSYQVPIKFFRGIDTKQTNNENSERHHVVWWGNLIYEFKEEYW